MGPIRDSDKYHLDDTLTMDSVSISDSTGSDAKSISNGFKSMSKANVTHRPKVLPNVLHQIGNTPMIRLNRIPQAEGIECEILAKCELYGPGGSHKDRIALRMIEEAEADGRLKPGSVIIEPTSGNTGVGVAMVAAVKGYKCILVMPEKMSAEKHETMTRLGATVVRTPKNVLHIAVAQQIHKDTPNSILLDQYGNPGNPRIHYEETAEEILDQCDGQIDMIVMGVGTGGIVTGVGRKIKEKCKNCIIVGVDPEGSIMALPDSINKTDTTFWEVEGIGHDWLPNVLDRSVIDKWVKCNDKETFNMARRIISEEGMLVGGSCGSALVGAIKAIKEAGLKKGQKCVIILPDSCRNYMTKFISDQWMHERAFLPDNAVTENYSWWSKPVSSITLEFPTAIVSSKTIGAAIELMHEHHLDQLPVVNHDGILEGMVTLNHLLKSLPSMQITKNNTVANHLFSQFKRVSDDDTLGKVNYILQANPYVVVIEPVIQGTENKPVILDKLKGVITSMDFIHKVLCETE